MARRRIIKATYALESFADTRVALSESILENIQVEVHSRQTIPTKVTLGQQNFQVTLKNPRQLIARLNAQALLLYNFNANRFFRRFRREILGLRKKRVQLLQTDARVSLVALPLAEIAVYRGEM